MARWGVDRWLDGVDGQMDRHSSLPLLLFPGPRRRGGMA